MYFKNEKQKLSGGGKKNISGEVDRSEKSFMVGKFWGRLVYVEIAVHLKKCDQAEGPDQVGKPERWKTWNTN